MASLVFKNRNPKTVKLAEKASNDREEESERMWAREGEKKYTHFEAKLIVSMAEIVVKPNKRSSTVGRKRENIEIYAC